MKRLALPIATLTGLLFPCLPTEAVCPKPDPKVCSEFFKSDAVFIGKVESHRTLPPKGSYYDGWLYHLRVRRVFRGTLGETVDVFTENSSGRFPLQVSREYLLFASQGEGRLEVDNCGNSSLFSEATARIPEIEKLGNASTGEIEGHVASRPTWSGVPGIQVSVRGEGRTYALVTDQNGWFRMTVEAGRYSIQVVSSHVSPFPLSYDDPDGFVVPRGGCAQVQFIVEAK